MVGLRMVKNLVLIEIEALPTQSAGGILLPENREERDRIGTVRAIGPLVRELAVGDRVVYNKFSERLPGSGKNFRVVKDENIQLVIDKDTDVRFPKSGSGAQATWENLD